MESFKKRLSEGYGELEKRLTEPGNGVNTRHISTTDPDASIVRHAGGKAKLRYKTHRAVDPRHEVITAVEVTTGSVSEGHKMEALIETHEANTITKVSAVPTAGTGAERTFSSVTTKK